MAGRKGPDLSSPAENPDFEAHVGNINAMTSSATPDQSISGHGWYRKAAQDVAHTAIGIHPGQMTPHPTEGKAGLSHDKPGTSNMGSQFVRNTLSDTKASEMGHAKGLGQGHAESYAATGRYQGQQVSHSNDQGRPFGMISHSPDIDRIGTGVAAMSPAGPTGMTWDNNPRAVADSTHLSDSQFHAIAHANTLKAGTPERKAASETAREPFKGTAMNHGTTQTVERGMRAMRGDFDGVENPLGVQKTGHFRNDILSEFSPGHPDNHTGMTGTIDKHQQDVIAGKTKPWGNDANGQTDRSVSTRAVGEDGLPKLSNDKGYAYHREVLHEAARRDGDRPKVTQAKSWVVQKDVKDRSRGRHG